MTACGQWARRLLAVVLLAVPASAFGQTNADVFMDLDREWTAARQTDAAGLTPLARGSLSKSQLEALGADALCFFSKVFCTEIDLLVPLTYNSNPTLKPQQARDGHAKPTLSVIGSLKLGEVFTAVASADTAFDRYIVESSANVDILKFWVGGAFAPPSPVSTLTWVLYAGYRPSLTFAPDFDHVLTTFHDVIGGGRVKHDFDLQSLVHRLSTTIEANAGHRSADPDTTSSVITAMSWSWTYGYYPNSEIALAVASATVKPTFNATWYDNLFGGQRRHDVRPGAIANVKWSPWYDSANPLLSGVTFVLQASFIRNISNVPNRSFTVWDVGPSLFFAYGKVATIVKPPVREPRTPDLERR